MQIVVYHKCCIRHLVLGGHIPLAAFYCDIPAARIELSAQIQTKATEALPNADDVKLSFARSGGAGGQNVNKVNTKVDMRIVLDDVAWLEEDAKDALKRRVGNN